MIGQSEHAFNAIHCFSIYYKYLTFKTDYETPKMTMKIKQNGKRESGSLRRQNYTGKK